MCSTRVVVCVHVPSLHFGFRGEVDEIEGALLAPSPPPFRNERGGAEAGTWEVVDDLVNDFLGERIHDEPVGWLGISWTKASGRMRFAWCRLLSTVCWKRPV